MDQLAGQPSGAVEAEVAVLDEQRHLERRPFRQAEFALALVADNPQPCQPGVDAEPGDAHHVVVVPQQRRPLAHRVVEDGVLAGRGQVFGPAVIRRRGEPAVQVHDGVTGQRGRVPVRGAAAQPRDTLHRHATGIGRLRSGRHDNRQRAVQLVAPDHRDRLAGLGFDRRARDRPVVAPDRRLRQVTVKAVLASANGHTQPAVLPRRDQPPWHRKGVGERGQRRGQRCRHALALPTFSRALLPARAGKQGSGKRYDRGDQDSGVAGAIRSANGRMSRASVQQATRPAIAAGAIPGIIRRVRPETASADDPVTRQVGQ
jgi:hypothetical protein